MGSEIKHTSNSKTSQVCQRNDMRLWERVARSKMHGSQILAYSHHLAEKTADIRKLALPHPRTNLAPRNSLALSVNRGASVRTTGRPRSLNGFNLSTISSLEIAPLSGFLTQSSNMPFLFGFEILQLDSSSLLNTTAHLQAVDNNSDPSFQTAPSTKIMHLLMCSKSQQQFTAKILKGFMLHHTSPTDFT
jgi:hypothetical protein